MLLIDRVLSLVKDEDLIESVYFHIDDKEEHIQRITEEEKDSFFENSTVCNESIIAKDDGSEKLKLVKCFILETSVRFKIYVVSFADEELANKCMNIKKLNVLKKHHLPLAKKGNEESMTIVANVFSKLNDFKQAFYWWKKLADRGHVYALFNVAYYYQIGKGVKEDKKLASQYHEKAAYAGNRQSQFQMGYSFEFGIDREINMEEALKWYHKSAEQGFSRSIFDIGRCYELGKGVEQDMQKAIQWYEKGSEHHHSLNNLGVIYYEGRGVTQDKEKAKEYWMKAKDRSSDACVNLGMTIDDEWEAHLFHYKDLPEFHPIGYYNWAMFFYKQCFENSHTNDLNEETERIVYQFRDFENVKKWLTQIRSKDFTQNLVKLGIMHINAEFYFKCNDEHTGQREGFHYLKLAAQQKNKDAEYNIGICYEKGKGGVKQNNKVAILWYERASLQGHKRATLRLAQLYEKEDEVKALEYNTKALSLTENKDIYIRSPLCRVYI